ncbi:MAG: DNA polymerase III subunit alpha, partial [Firmicutes bacterium]|nr:DNA polymerase III subunit alpha [Bacillota bacterium]
QDHGIAEQQQVNQALLRINKETGIPLVCTNDLHYIDKTDAEAHDVLLCIQTKHTISEENRMRYQGDQFYLKSPEEMAALFPYAPEALENTVKIAERCNVSFEFNQYKLPVFDVPGNKSSFDYLKELCGKGLKKRYKEMTPELTTRLEYELSTIKDMGFVDYFLIVSDFIAYAKNNGIMVGPGRGSAAGSIVAYSLGITDIDTIRFDLLFERFLNPERVSMPDIDIDFCIKRRQEVINYVSEKYGHDHVAQIVTFGTLAARNVTRDVGRVLEIPYADVDRIAKMIPTRLPDGNIHVTINDALNVNAELRAEYENDPKIKNLLDMAMKLEGLPRNTSTHAAGVVICDRPIVDYVPLSMNDDVVTTQYTMTTIEELGLLKMDFLGLRNLTIIQNAFDLIGDSDAAVSFSGITCDDPKVFELISSGNTDGIFQLESPGMKQFMKELKPRNIDDVIAGISLYRPGPMDFIPNYIKGKTDPKNITYLHPSLEKILKPTYGCIVYQEQVMQIVRDLAGYNLGRSDLVRRAMSKKKAKVMAEERHNFIYGIEGELPGCINNGISEDIANKIFDAMTDFAKYAFNKSHAAAYAVVAYQTAWLKCYYPVEFMTALISSVSDNLTKVTEYILASKKMGITVLQPDVNKSFADFSVSDGKIRFGLSAIKNVGKNTIFALEKERSKNGEFKSLADFIERLSSELNTRTLESLIKAGAFDSLGGKRSQYMAVYNSIYNSVNHSKKNNLDGQLSIFEFLDDEKENLVSDNLPSLEEYPKKLALSYEKEVLGLYISGHPLSDYSDILSSKVTATSIDFLYSEDEPSRLSDGESGIIGGIITSVSVKYTKKGQKMAFLTLEDMLGTVEVIVFSYPFQKYSEFFKEDEVILIKGHVSSSLDRDSKFICDEVFSADSFRTLWLKIPADSSVTRSDIMEYLTNNPYKGSSPVAVYDESKKELLRLNPSFSVSLSDELISALKTILGNKSVVIKATESNKKQR